LQWPAPRLAAFAFLLMGGCAAPAQTLEEFQKSVHEKVSKYSTIQYRSIVETDFRTPGLTVKGRTEQLFQTARKDGRILFRAETTVRNVQKIDGEDVHTDANTLEIGDGQFCHTLIETIGDRLAYRDRIDPKTAYDSFNPRADFERMKKESILRIVPGETVNGRATIGLEVTPRATATSAPADDSTIRRTVFYYDKQHGLVAKSVAWDASGRVAATTLTEQVRIDEPIDAERFVFKLPAGVKLEDRTIPPKAGG
jgi:outer membrane lipoprotein-sorting protein